MCLCHLNHKWHKWHEYDNGHNSAREDANAHKTEILVYGDSKFAVRLYKLIVYLLISGIP